MSQYKEKMKEFEMCMLCVEKPTKECRKKHNDWIEKIIEDDVTPLCTNVKK